MSPCYNVTQALILLASAVLTSHALSLALDVLFRAPLWPSLALSLVLDVLLPAAPLLSPALVDMLFLVPPLPSHAPPGVIASHAFHALFFLIDPAIFPLSLFAGSTAVLLLHHCAPAAHDSLTLFFYLASSYTDLHFDPTYCLEEVCTGDKIPKSVMRKQCKNKIRN
jgi:hypothetical protein